MSPHTLPAPYARISAFLLALAALAGGHDPLEGGEAALSAAPPGRPVPYRFERAGPAYRATPDGITTASVDTPILRPVAITSLTDGEYIRDGAHAGVDVIPRTRNSRYLFGVAENGGIYRSQDGVAWQHVLSVPASNLVALHDDALLRVERIDDLVHVYRSDDDGLTWVEATEEDGVTPFRWRTPGAWLATWAFTRPRTARW